MFFDKLLQNICSEEPIVSDVVPVRMRLPRMPYLAHLCPVFSIPAGAKLSLQNQELRNCEFSPQMS